MNKKGELMQIGYSIDVDAVVSIEWETDEQPTGWNYRTDDPIYSSYEYAVGSSPEITSISFTPDQEFYINDEVHSLYDAQNVFDPAVMKQLLNPKIYTSLLQPYFDKKVEDLEPPDHRDELDDYDRDYY